MNLLQTRTYVRALLAEDVAVFWSDAQLNLFIQRSFLTVYTQIAQMGRGYFQTTGFITYVAGQELYSLATIAPLGFVKLDLVERVDIPPKITLLPVDVSEKNNYAQAAGSSDMQGYERYFMSGNNIGFAPPPVSGIANVVQLWFVPVPALPVADNDVFPADFTELHHECIAQGAYMRACQRDKQLLALVSVMYKDLMELVKADTQQRITQEPRRIIDTDTMFS